MTFHHTSVRKEAGGGLTSCLCHSFSFSVSMSSFGSPSADADSAGAGRISKSVGTKTFTAGRCSAASSAASAAASLARSVSEVRSTLYLVLYHFSCASVSWHFDTTCIIRLSTVSSFCTASRTAASYSR